VPHLPPLEVPNDHLRHLPGEGLFGRRQVASVLRYLDAWVGAEVQEMRCWCPRKKLWVRERMWRTTTVDPRG
jgi:hypothetical protein